MFLGSDSVELLDSEDCSDCAFSEKLCGFWLGLALVSLEVLVASGVDVDRLGSAGGDGLGGSGTGFFAWAGTGAGALGFVVVGLLAEDSTAGRFADTSSSVSLWRFAGLEISKFSTIRGCGCGGEWYRCS